MSQFLLSYLLSIRDNFLLKHEATILQQVLTCKFFFCTYFTVKWFIQSSETFKQVAELQQWLSDNNETRQLKTLILFLPCTQADIQLRSFHICLSLRIFKRHSSSQLIIRMRLLLGLQYISALGAFGHYYLPNYSSPN